MCICILDGEKIKDRQMLHDTLYDSLELPEWYGRNLDALHDCLTELTKEVEIQLLNETALEEHLGSYAKVLTKVLLATAEENSKIRLNRQ